MHLVRLLRRSLLASTGGSPSTSPPHPFTLETYALPTTGEWENAWQLTFALIRKTRREATSAGARFAVGVLPAGDVVSPGAWDGYRRAFPALAGRVFDLEQPTRRMVSFLEAEAIPTINLLAALRKVLSETGESGFFGYDSHLNLRGHAVIATALTGFVRAQVERAKRLDGPAGSGDAGSALQERGRLQDSGYSTS